MADIMVYIVYKDKTIGQLYQLKLLDDNDVMIIRTTPTNFKALIITKLVAHRILNGHKDDFTTRVATFTESHWALKYLYQYWKNKCERFLFISKLELESNPAE